MKSTPRFLGQLGPFLGLVTMGLSLGVNAGDIAFQRFVIDDRPPENPWYKMLGDINGDGQLDIIVAGQRGPLVWYAYPHWERSEIAARGWDGVHGEAADLDGDGATDVVMGGVVWFRNPRGEGGPWVLHRIDTQKAHDIETGDLDRDGKMDVVARDQSAFGGTGNEVFVYRQIDPTHWDRRTLDCPHGEGLELADLDRDGDLDILVGGRWYENDGRPIRGAWTEHRMAGGDFDQDCKIAAADLNGDGRLDVVLAPAELAGQTNRLLWYEAPMEPRTEAWMEHIIVPAVETVVHGLALADFDGDGHVDVAYAEMHQGQDPDEVCVLQNLGSGQSWRKTVLSVRGSHDIVAGDLGGDGSVDIIGANWSGPDQPVEWWRNNSMAGK